MESLSSTNPVSVDAESSKTLTHRAELITAEQPTEDHSLHLLRQKSLPLSILDTMPQLRLQGAFKAECVWKHLFV